MSRDSLEKAIVKHVKSGPGPGYQGPYFSEAAGCKPGTLMERGPSYRSLSPGVFCKKGVLKIFDKFTGKHLRWGLFF